MIPWNIFHLCLRMRRRYRTRSGQLSHMSPRNRGQFLSMRHFFYSTNIRNIAAARERREGVEKAISCPVYLFGVTSSNSFFECWSLEVAEVIFVIRLADIKQDAGIALEWSTSNWPV